MDMLIFGLPVVAITIGLVEVVKKLGIPTRWCALISIAIGIVLAYIGGGFIFNPEMIIGGIVIGLTASGFYSGAKATIKKKDEKKTE